MRKHVIFILAVFFLFSCEYRDEVPPAVNITRPEDGQIVADKMEILVAATDNTSIRNVALILDDRYITDATGSPFMLARWENHTLDDGRFHILRAVATDKEGNSSESPPVRILVNSIPAKKCPVTFHPDPTGFSWPSFPDGPYDIHLINPENPNDTLATCAAHPDTFLSVGNLTDVLIQIRPQSTDTVTYHRYATFTPTCVFLDIRDDGFQSAYIRSIQTPFIRRITHEKTIYSVQPFSGRDQVNYLLADGLYQSKSDGSGLKRIQPGNFFRMDVNPHTGDILLLSYQTVLICQPDGKSKAIPFKGYPRDIRWSAGGERILLTGIPYKLEHRRIYEIDPQNPDQITLLSPNEDLRDYSYPLAIDPGNHTLFTSDSTVYHRNHADGSIHTLLRFDGEILQLEGNPETRQILIVLQKQGLMAGDTHYDVLSLTWPGLEQRLIMSEPAEPDLRLSPSGEYLLYNQNGHLCISDNDGQNERILENTGYGQAW